MFMEDLTWYNHLKPEQWIEIINSFCSKKSKPYKATLYIKNTLEELKEKFIDKVINTSWSENKKLPISFSVFCLSFFLAKRYGLKKKEF
jgi:hypothetical protein